MSDIQTRLIPELYATAPTMKATKTTLKKGRITENRNAVRPHSPAAPRVIPVLSMPPFEKNADIKKCRTRSAAICSTRNVAGLIVGFQLTLTVLLLTAAGCVGNSGGLHGFSPVDAATRQQYAPFDLSAAAESKGSIASAAERRDAKTYFTELFSNLERLPLSFELDGKTYHGFDGDFEVAYSDGVICAKHQSGVTVIVSYSYNYDYAAFEWIVHFRNDSKHDSGVLKNVMAADIEFYGTSPRLEYMLGEAHNKADSYALAAKDLNVDDKIALDAGIMGKSSQEHSPFNRLFFGDGGVTVALGWQGRWKMDYSVRADLSGVPVTRLRAGQYVFAAKLKPGEEVRTPRVTLIKYGSRDRLHAINMWRRWFFDCAFHRYKGEIVKPTLILADGCLPSDMRRTEKMLLDQIEKFNNNAGTNYLTNIWLDAGWYQLKDGKNITRWEETGTWKMDNNRFPTGMRAVSDAMNAKGGFTNLWFEPERIARGTELFDNEEWTLAHPEHPNTKLLNFGLKPVQDWWLKTVDDIMTRGGISMYRQDFNFWVYSYYLLGDATQGDDRAGITENLHIKGLTEFYHKLLARHPQMPLDMCASGGQRNDMDVLRISEIFTETDHPQSDSIQMQTRRLEFYAWTSLVCGGNPVNTRYGLLSSLGYNMTLLAPADTAIWEQVNYLFLCDYYPLTEWTMSPSAWCGWEFYDTSFNEGFAQFVRRPDAPDAERTFKLHGLNADRTYIVRELFSAVETERSGASLMHEGLKVILPPGDGAIYKLVEK